MTKLNFTLCAVLLIGLASCGNVSTSTDSARVDSMPTIANETPAKQENNSWEYSEEIDEMTDKTTYIASINSTNEVEFGFPYEGGSSLRLILRDSPQYGKDIMISISSGQFNTDIYGTKIKVRFDDAPAFDVKCNEPSDVSSDVLFLTNYSKLIKLMKESKTLKINAEFFQEGVHTFTFDIEGLKWEH